MFKYYKEISDVVTLVAYCPCERTFLLAKDPSGEFWLPSSKIEKNCWKMTAQKINFELFGTDAVSCVPLRVYRIWLPNHSLPCAYHAVYKVPIKPDMKKKIGKAKHGIRGRLQWYSTTDLERQRAHNTLRSPEVAVYAKLAVGDQVKDIDGMEMETGTLIEICEENIIVGAEGAAGAVALTSLHYQLLQAAGYSREDQVRMYREFLLMVYPALYMSPHVFSQFMIDIGWESSQCLSLFRAADVMGRGALSYLEFLLWSASLEPSTHHSGVPAEIRCRYIFRYFDSNRDMKLQYEEFKELVAATRAARQLPVDALSVARDAEVCYRQLGLQPNTQLQLADFLRGVGELRLRGTSSLLRAPKSVSAYLVDLQEREKDQTVSCASDTFDHAKTQTHPQAVALAPGTRGTVTPNADRASASQVSRRALTSRADYSVAVYTVRLHKRAPLEMLELKKFAEDAVSLSTIRLLNSTALSMEVLASSAAPVEALEAVHYFAAPCEKPRQNRTSTSLTPGTPAKPAWAWQHASEEAALGTLLLKLAEAVRPICAAEPRLLRLASPVYIIGDLHGNLNALLTMEAALWPSGGALTPANLLFLGDYVDRGPHGTELMAYLLAAKLQRPNGVLLIRGNHETRDIQRMFTFYTECVSKYGEVEGGRIWSAINNVFDVLPLAALIDEKVFCCHGGIPPPWVCPLISAIDKVPCPLPRPCEQSSIAWELLWNDPIKQTKMTNTLALELAANEGFAANAKRGTGHVFDQTALDRFLLANQLSHVVRAHEVHQNGFMCQLRGRLISVFSSSHYCGGTNDSGIAMLEGGKLRLLRVNGDEK